MKKLLDVLFRGGIFMAPKWAVIIILFGCFAAIGEQNGLDKAVYTSIGALGLVLGIGAILYSVKEESREQKDREARSKEAEAIKPLETPPVVVYPTLPTHEV